MLARSRFCFSWCLLAVTVLSAGIARAQHHEHGAAEHAKVEKPRIFLDKSPRVVAYQLKRLDNQRLLLVDRRTDDPKYAPVYKAILLREGMSPQYRQEAIDGLVTLNGSNVTQEVVAAMESLDGGKRQDRRTARELASLLLAAERSALRASVKEFEGATRSSNGLVRQAGYAGFVASGLSDRAIALADSPASTMDLLRALPMVPAEQARNTMRDRLMSLVDDSPSTDLRATAIAALRHVTEQRDDTFRRLASLIPQPELRPAVVTTLLSIPAEQRDQAVSSEVLESLVKLAEETPAAERTTDDFLSAMQLADQLLARVPASLARQQRKRLREVTVQVVVVHTVEEEMRYDLPYFAVEAGRPVQILLKNEDLMPHNLVLVQPGSLQAVAELGLATGPKGFEGKDYVPDDPQVLQATHMVAPAKQERLTFTAPTEPGEYPYVCTFPRHWMRMYGVMLVVEDLDAWLENPVEPKDPLGSTRPFVKNWTLDDFADLAQGVRGRDLEIGQRIFKEATCSQCHQVGGVGGAVGPELTGVLERSKGDLKTVLHEILDPSHRIDPKYAVHLIVTVEGLTISGIVAKDDKQSVGILTNPESQELTEIARDDIEEMIKTATSMMPKGLLDRFTKDEIFELLAFLASLEQASNASR